MHENALPGDVNIVFIGTAGIWIRRKPRDFLSAVVLDEHLFLGEESGVVLAIAHRGASGHAPENTLAAFRKAVAMGARSATQLLK